MVLAVSGLSPVIMMVRMPIRRSSAKRSAMPGLTVSLSSMTPSGRPSQRMARGVAPAPAMASLMVPSSGGGVPARPATMASVAPFMMVEPSVRVTPLVRRSAENGDDLADAAARSGVLRGSEHLPRQGHYRAALRGLVVERGQQRGRWPPPGR